MTRAIRNAALFAVLAAGAFLASGCGSSSDCNVTPDIATHPNACSLAANTTVTVNARWCSCSATTTCDAVNVGGGVIQLEPKVASCDATCETNPASCSPNPVPCVFTTPDAGNYNLYFISGSGFESVPLTVSAGGGNSCG